MDRWIDGYGFVQMFFFKDFIFCFLSSKRSKETSSNKNYSRTKVIKHFFWDSRIKFKMFFFRHVTNDDILVNIFPFGMFIKTTCRKMQGF